MTNPKPIYKILTAIFVVFFGWGSMYLVSGVIRDIQPAPLAKQSIQNTNLEASAINSNENNPDKENPVFIPVKNKKELVVMLSGDIMFDRHIRVLGEKNGYDSLFDQSVISLFRRADIVSVNLEGPITPNPSKTLIDGKTTNELVFTFSPDSISALINSGITLVSLANNHTDNFGFSGFKETQEWLSKAGIEWFGNPWNGTTTSLRIDSNNLPSASQIGFEQTNSPVVTFVKKKEITIAFVGYNAFQTGVDRVLSEIKKSPKMILLQS